jgi:sugar phosphate isomerase/epimerase
MVRAASTYIFVHERLQTTRLDALVRGGAQAIEIFGARQHFDYTHRVHVKEIAAWFAENQITPHSVHAPLYTGVGMGRDGQPQLNLVDKEKPARVVAMDEMKRALEAAEQLPFRYFIQHIGTPNEKFDPLRFDDAMTAIEHLRAFAKPLGVTVLLENIPNEFTAPERLMELIQTAHFSDVGICFDVGHAHLGDGVVASFELMKKHIRSTHLHDNEGLRDQHLWPGEGKINWNQALELLRTAPHAPPMLLEIEHTDGVNVQKKMADAFAMMEKAGSEARA